MLLVKVAAKHGTILYVFIPNEEKEKAIFGLPMSAKLCKIIWPQMTFRRSTCFGNNADGENLANFFKLWKAHSCHLRFFHSFFTHKVQDLHPHKEMGAAIYSLYRIASAPIHLLRILGKKKMKAYKKRRANAIAADEGCRENKEVHSRVMWAGPFFAYLWGHGTAHNERHTQIYHKVFFFSPPLFPTTNTILRVHKRDEEQQQLLHLSHV